MTIDTQAIEQDIRNYIQENTRNFTGREWVFQEIDRWLADPTAARIFLLEGEPGSGKTALASRLAQFSLGDAQPPASTTHLQKNFLSAIYFCSAHRDKRDILPNNFSTSLMAQLSARYEAYIPPLVEKAGVYFNVNQDVGIGSPTGIVIKQLSIHMDRMTNPEDAFQFSILEPLPALVQADPARQILFLIDGLDEAALYSGRINIVSLLARVNDLPQNVRFICTTRSDNSRVKSLLSEINVFYFSAQNYDKHNHDDIYEYVVHRFTNEATLSDRIAKYEQKQKKVQYETITQKASGNFLYVLYLLNAIERGQQSLKSLKDLPVGLDKLYFTYLQRIIPPNDDSRWDEEYAPFMQILSVAQEHMTLTQLMAFTGKSKLKVKGYYRNLQHFIECTDDGEQKDSARFRLFHQSFIDFLGSSTLHDGTDNRFYLPVEECHSFMAECCAQEGLDIIWQNEKYDDIEQERRLYARKYYILHLYESGPRYRRELHNILTEESYGRAKLKYDPSMRSYILDLDLGRQALLSNNYDEQESVERLPRLWRYSLLHCSLVSKADQYPAEAFRLAMMLHLPQDRFYGLVDLITQALNKVEALVSIAEFTTDDEAQDHLLRKIVDVITDIEDESEQQLARQRLGQLLANIQHPERVEAIFKLIDDIAKQEHLIYCVCETLINRQRFEQALCYIELFNDENKRAQVYYNIAVQYIDTNQFEDAYKAIGQAHGTPYYVMGLCKFIKALASREDEASRLQAQTTLESLEQHIQTLSSAKERVEMRFTLVEALEDLVAKEAVQKVLQQIDDDVKKSEWWILRYRLWAKQKKWPQLTDALQKRIRDRKSQVKVRDFYLQELIKNQQLDLLRKQIPVNTRNSRLQQSIVKQIIEHLAEKLYWQEAEDILTGLEKNVVAEARYILATKQAKLHLWEQAYSNIEKLGDPNLEISSWYTLIQELILEHQWAEAERHLDHLSIPLKIKALCELGIEYAREQQPEKAAIQWSRVEALLGTMQEQHVHRKALAVLSAAETSRQQTDYDNESVGERITHFFELSKNVTSNAIRSMLLQGLAGMLAKACELEMLQRILEEIQDNSRKIEVLQAIGEARLKVEGEEHLVAQTIQAMEAIVEDTQDQMLKDLQQVHLVHLLAQAKMWEQAEQRVENIHGNIEKIQALGRLAVVRSQAQQVEEAEQVWSKARALVNVLSEPKEKDDARCALARFMAQARDWYAAYALISLMELKNEKISALSKLGESFMLAQQPHYAQQAWAAAKECLLQLQTRGERDAALRALSSALINAQEGEEARKIVNEIQNPLFKTRALAELGSLFWKSEKRKQAELVWMDAEESLLLSVPGISERLHIYAELAIGMVRARAWEHAENIWHEILEQQDILLTQQEAGSQDQPVQPVEEFATVVVPGTTPTRKKKRRTVKPTVPKPTQPQEKKRRSRGRRGRGRKNKANSEEIAVVDQQHPEQPGPGTIEPLAVS